MNKLQFLPEEIKLLKFAYSLGHHGWQLNKLKPIKKKIKIKKRADQEEVCCYCQRDTTGEYAMVLDIEHILPKSLRLRNMFTLKNLGVSCKRCNMEIKGTNTDFLTVPISRLPKRAFRSSFYKFVHPNLDNTDSHIKRIVVQEGRARIVKYIFPNRSAKGKYTYTFFKLMELEVDSANIAQGKKSRNTIKNARLQKAFNALKQ
jgi:uncharacterized protein (TIGR02646 family)